MIKKNPALKVTDLSTAVYLLFTGLLILIFPQQLAHSSIHLFFRLGVFLFMTVLIVLQHKRKSKILTFIQLFYPLVLLTYAFGETAYFNHLFFSQPFDPWLFHTDQRIFGFQPAIEFSKHLSQAWIGELLNLSYFLYYFMTVGVAFAFYIRYPELAEKVIFIIITSFYIYYLIFIFFPSEGPRYFLTAPLNQPVHSGIFSNLVQTVEHYGDYPTGAFPSSHVGVAVIYLLLTFRKLPRLFWLLFPFVILICFATVYIKAHYAIDVLGGLISAPLIYLLSIWIYERLPIILKNTSQ